MCPACIANIALMAAGATSGGGAAAFVFRSFYKSNNQIKTEDETSRKEKGRGETFRNRVAERVRGRAPTTGREGEGVNTRKNECPKVIR